MITNFQSENYLARSLENLLCVKFNSLLVRQERAHMANTLGISLAFLFKWAKGKRYL